MRPSSLSLPLSLPSSSALIVHHDFVHLLYHLGLVCGPIYRGVSNRPRSTHYRLWGQSTEWVPRQGEYTFFFSYHHPAPSHISLTCQLKPNTEKANTLNYLETQHTNTSQVKYADWSSDVMHGFAAQLQPDALDALRANSDVESIYEDGMAQLADVVNQ